MQLQGKLLRIEPAGDAERMNIVLLNAQGIEDMYQTFNRDLIDTAGSLLDKQVIIDIGLKETTIKEAV